ncbi:hypothetical protein MMC19_006712 [Ptychographa xylographoides]|nr:hypothetical protein [Ptychographa xylographoides]
MPPVRSARNRKPPPEGFDDLEDTLLEFSNKMKDAENASHEGKKRHEVLWPIFQISHQRSRYVYDLYYDKEAISKQLYEWLLKNGYADANLIAKWKKQGYEKVGSSTLTLCKCREANIIRNQVMLFTMYPNQGNKLQRDLYLPCTKGAAKGRSDDRVCQLWVSRLRFCGLTALYDTHGIRSGI